MKNLIKHILLLGLVVSPIFARAQLGGLGNLLGEVDMLVGLTITILLGLALLVFFWGLVKFILAAGSEDAAEQGKRIMLWGLVGLFVMVSVWGLVRFMQEALLGGADLSAPAAPLPPGN